MKRPLENHSDDFQKNPIVYFDIAVGSEKLGRVVIELFKDIAPKTAENFRALCTGEKGIGINGKKLHYKGSIFHKTVHQFMIQGGDIINFDGTSGESIYGKHFEDESFELSHSSAGLLSMVNEGRPNSNSSQFIITTADCLHLDTTHVVFGKVLKGMGVVFEANNVKTEQDRPMQKIQIIDCGELKRGNNWGLEENDGTEDTFAPWPEDWDYESHVDKLSFEIILQVIAKIKNSGNYYFMKGNYNEANRKYKKALRYYYWMLKLENLPNNPNDYIKNYHTLLLNLAAVKLKMNDFRETLNLCNEVLEAEKTNSKALFRRGQANMGLNEYELCLIDLKNALCESPNNKDILREIEKVKKIMNSYLVIEKAACARMFK
ncbi:peptidyl-prolyl cis-trans isomerase D [Prorops nasuta]|uniref:peptidyl-prolyl cis-trans isomerase D n=1 Tax=Prorops nasuta TaxID=863751 RepID=UPI0034CFFA89